MQPLRDMPPFVKWALSLLSAIILIWAAWISAQAVQAGQGRVRDDEILRRLERIERLMESRWEKFDGRLDRIERTLLVHSLPG